MHKDALSYSRDFAQIGNQFGNTTFN